MAAFATALDGRVPENTLLSHDLFEGIFARAGLVTDIELFEEFPSDYEVAAGRQYRWARGDWQLLPWLLQRDVTGGRRGGRLPLIGAWKIADNLRRTLSAPAAWLTLVSAWTLPGSPALVWTTFVLATLALPALLPALADVIPRRRGISKRTYVRSAGRSFALSGSQIALGVTFLAHQAWLMSDAIGRTLVRLYVTHRRLLEWTTAAQAKADMSRDVPGAYRRMGGALILAAASGVVVAIARPESAAIAAPFALAWALSPLAARWVSRPPRPSPAEILSAADRQILRSTARRTWRFFETFVGPDDAFLPPDNFQEDPRPTVAHRTSPTNIGLYLLAIVAARDFGWLGVLDTLDRLEATLGTMRRLERFRGHFYNWYDTGGLRPLEPRYVSTVDSGNLAAHLLTLGNACRSALHEPLLDPARLDGLRDAVLLAAEAASGLADDRRTQTVTLRDLTETCAALTTALHEPPATPAEWAARLRDLALHADTLVDMSRALTAERGEPDSSDVRVWAQAARATIAGHERDLQTILPWASLLETDLATGHPDLLTALRSLRSSSPHPRGSARPLPAGDRRADGPSRDRAPRGPRGRGDDRGPRPGHRRPGALLGGRRHARPSPPGRRSRRAGARRRHAVRFPLRPQSQDLLHRLPGHRRQPRLGRVRPARLRGAARQLRGHRQGRRPGVALVPPRPADDPGGNRVGAAVLVRLHVRVPDARARHAVPRGQPARRDLSPRGPPSDELRRGARRPLGHLRVGLQRARPGSHLPVLELRRPRSRPRAGSRGRPGRCALRDRPRRDGRSGGRRPEPLGPRRGGRPRAVRLLRGPRLHAIADPRGEPDGDRPGLHGAPSGHDPHRPLERAPRRRDARAVPRRAHRAGDRPAPPGAGAPRRGRRAPPGRGGARAGPSPRLRRARLPAVHDSPQLPRPGRTCSRTGATP